MCEFANALSMRFELTGQLDDLDTAIESHVQAESAMPEDHVQRPGQLHNIGSQLSVRYKYTNDVEDLEAAIANTELAISINPGGDDEGQSLHNLSLMLSNQFERTRNMQHLDAAIFNAKLALTSKPNTKYQNDRAKIRQSLIYGLLRRYEYLGNMDDIEVALAYANDGIAAMHDDDPDRWQALGSLASVLYTRYLRARAMSDLEIAISKMELAVSIVPEHNTHLSSLLQGQGDMYLRRYYRTEDIEDLNLGIHKMKLSLSRAPESPSFKSKVLGSLGSMLSERYEHEKDVADLDEGIRLMELALTFITENHHDLSGALMNLGHAQYSRMLHPGHDITLRTVDLKAAMESYIMASRCPNGVPLHRIQAARWAMRLIKRLEMWEAASKLAWETVELLPLVCGRNLGRADQQYAILQISGFAADACSMSLLAGQVDQALQLVEYGRGLILGYLIDGRDDLSLLKQDNQELAQEFERLRLEITGTATPMPDAIQTQTLRGRGDVAREFDICLERIRQLEGYERFLKEPTLEELKQCAMEGPIVVVNVTDISSDAIIVSTSGIRWINLPEMSFSQAKFLVSNFNQYRSTVDDRTHGEAARDMGGETEGADQLNDEFLSWLWSSCVEPILEKLPSSAGTSRVWWTGSGVASSLPFHAADYHTSGSMDNTLSRIIPSYTSTIKSLVYARSCAARSMGSLPEKTSVLMVAMPETPGHQALPGIMRECLTVQKALSDRFTLESLLKPSVEQAMARMTESDIIHFACHGLSDQANPSNSHILLQKYTPSGVVVDKLTVQKLSELQSIGRGRIAYLSACSTAEVKAENFADEALHMVSAFQVAGFGHVIGSLWFADDDTCVEMAKVFYGYLSTNMQAEMTNRLIAEALRHAVLTTRSGRSPDLWAPFIHFGA